MISRTSARFRKAFSELPELAQSRARVAYRNFLVDSNHPGLQFKQVHPSRPIYSVRIGLGYRALGIWEDALIWFWIGTHAGYDKLLKTL